MSLFKKIFSGQDASATVDNHTSVPISKSSMVSFGRYTDINKNKKQLEHWKNANDRFKEKNYVDSYEEFLNYLRDDAVNNVTITRTGDVVTFELIQGSKIIRGKGDNQKFYAEAEIVVMDQSNIAVMRKLMSINYVLRYSKFALKDNVVMMKFSSHSIDASPGKLYDALKELSKKADQQDDLLVQEFGSLKEINTESIIQWPHAIQEAKYNYLVKMINEVKEEIAKHDQSFMSGGIAYLLLNLTYEIDYLIVPQGELTDALERIQQMFFAQNDKTTQERNNDILAEYDKILNTPKEKVMEGIYQVNCTFAIANPAAHKTVMDFMFQEREKVGWYRDNNYPQMVEAIYSYMISYAYFNYGMVYPVTRILNLAMCVMNQEYYTQCGSSPVLIENGALKGSVISKEINDIITDARKDYAQIAFNTSALNFTSIANFVDSMLLELDKMNLTK
ncbi:MAG: hypothetical protein R2780_02985 [Crocinitomicaceae bacterium]|nr:hypothetical protein [Crocinitomicaceae bacterium]